MLPKQGKKRQCQRVTRHGDQRPGCVLQPMRWMLVKIAAAKQRAPEEIAASAPRRRNYFVDNRFVAPDKGVALAHHPAKEIHIFARSVKLRAERGIHPTQDAALKEHVASASLIPIHFVSGLVGGAVEEFALLHPGWRLMFKTRHHRPKNAIHSKSLAGFHQIEEPVVNRKLVVINKGDEVSFRMS